MAGQLLLESSSFELVNAVSVFFLVFSTLLLFALCWYLCYLFRAVPVRRDSIRTQAGCWEGGAGIDRDRG
jgi:hypothetical protein